ncbi:Hypothetical protein LUCI_5158 [Lucifera butyrica]|uniref:Arabinogalactan endo-beta-1,4-galactanase n=1 Tax=Lucifera butyrica TaxID=1351585 RepID=A0A498RGC4_9FIRM|nr:glycosyl hydrolase 53 family protein [Lucifera butyrica]VBB09860.1 Hypothetical protein LUCI_5158 [Lucifera butyrica]
MAFILTVGFTAFLPASANAAGQSIRVNPVSGISPDFIKGADVSMLKQIEISGGKFYDQGLEKDCLQILKDHGVNWVRLRIWNNPNGAGGGNNDEARTLELAARAKTLGLKVLLDFHYSDFWADPSKQNKPAAWARDSGARLQQDVYAFTGKVIQDMKKQGTMPDMVQIGNEISNGMLWPDGQLFGAGAGGYAGLAGLLEQGIKAVRDNDPAKTVKIMIHLANGGDNALYRSFFDELIHHQQVTDFDVIGLSYYPYWHGTLAQLKANMNDISARYNKDVVVAETAYGFTLKDADKEKNLFGPNEEFVGGYRGSVQGQATAVRDVMAAVAQVPNGRGLGIFYWEPDWIPVEGAGWKTGEGDGWDNQAMFDFKGNVLPSLDVFRRVSESGVPEQSVIKSLYPVNLKVKVGQAPELPKFVNAVYSDDSIKPVAVKWDDTNVAGFDAPGEYTLHGSVEGANGDAVAAINVVDQVNLVKNPGFETGGLAEWTVQGDAGAVNTVQSSGDVHSGKSALHYWADKAFHFTASQTVTGLKNGKYVLTAWAQGGGGEKSLQLFASDYGGEKLTARITDDGWNHWHQYVIKDISVTNGQCTVGFDNDANAGNWGTLDDVELYAE